MLNFSLLGCVEVGFLKRYPYPWHTDTYLNAVVALAPAGNQIKLDWAGKLGLGPGLLKVCQNTLPSNFLA